MQHFFTEKVCRNQNNHLRSSVNVIAETTTDLIRFKISTPSSNLLDLVLPGAWGKVRKDRSWKFPLTHASPLLQTKRISHPYFAPGQSSQQSHSKEIITGMYTVTKNCTAVCNWCQRLLIQNSRWKELLVKPDLALIWTSALNKQLVL